jgi:hypothetical protein
MSFFIVYVDITGSEKPSDPHTIQYDETSDEFPDVYAFAILPTGDAIPLGLPEFNDRILTAKVAYKKDHITYYTQDTYSYRQAKNAAWKYYTNNNSKYFFDKKISFTYNDFIQDILSRNSSKIYTSIDTQNYNYYRSGKSVYLSECKPDSDTALTAYNICSVQLQTPNFNY